MIPNTTPSKQTTTSTTYDVPAAGAHHLDIDESESGAEASLSSMAEDDYDGDDDTTTLSQNLYSPMRPLQQHDPKQELEEVREPKQPPEDVIMSNSSSSSAIGQTQSRNIPTPSSGYEGDTEGAMTDTATACEKSAAHPYPYLPHHHHHHRHHHHSHHLRQQSPFSSGAECE
ncbi:hypothetical protein BX666DRAFT_2116852 [Dichotomocladium elegans]|nr:hypothetical protein BX666DRAFT_2116852 [Dichotomocladium elegans]